MGEFIAKIIYGSQNYLLDTPESDKDYKLIEFPNARELFFSQKLNRQLNDHESVWDIRDFCKFLMKANPNALEMLFSVEITYADDRFKELLDFIRTNVESVIRVNWSNFSKATYGLAHEAIYRNSITPKSVARLAYFHLLWDSVAFHNGKMTVKTWRDERMLSPRNIRMAKEDDPQLSEFVTFVDSTWDTNHYAIVVSEEDQKMCKEIEKRCVDYFHNRLTFF